MAIQPLVVEGVAEGLEAIDARNFTGGRTFEDLLSRGHHLTPPLTGKLDEAGTAGHRVVEIGVDGVTVSPPQDENVQVLWVHLKDPRRAHSQGFGEAVGLSGIGAPREHQHIDDHLGVEGRRIWRLAAAVGMVGSEAVPLRLAGKRRSRLSTDRTEGVPQVAVANSRRWADIGKPEVYPTPAADLGPAPGVSRPALVALQLLAVDRHGHLEAVILLVADVGEAGHEDVGHCYRTDHLRPDAGETTVYLGDRPASDIDSQLERLLLRVKAVEARGEAMAVGVHKHSRHVLSQRHSDRPAQVDRPRTGNMRGEIEGTDDGAGLQTVPGEKALGRQHPEGLGVVITLSLRPLATVPPPEPPEEAIAAMEERLLLRVQSPPPMADGIEPLDLCHGPAHSSAECRHNPSQRVRSLVDQLCQPLGLGNRGVLARPALAEGGGGAVHQLVSVSLDNVP